MDKLKLPISLKLIRSINFPRKLGILDRLFGKFLAKQETQWVQTYPGITWKLDLTSQIQRWLVYGYYENKNVMRWIQRLFENGGNAIESGVSYGQTLVYYIELADKVITIDPLPKAINWIEEIIEHNEYEHVTTVHAGLYNKPQKLNLQIRDEQSTFRPDWYTTKGHKTIEVQCFTLDEITNQHQIDHVRLWKLDVEGLDYEALEGAKNLLSEHRIDAIYIEITENNFDNVSSLLSKFRYELFTIDNDLNVVSVKNPDKTISTSYIALPKT